MLLNFRGTQTIVDLVCRDKMHWSEPLTKIRLMYIDKKQGKTWENVHM